MSNIYDALEQAFRETGRPAVFPPFAVEVRPALPLREEMAWLHHQVERLKSPSRLIQFIGCGRGGGVTTIVREFARIAVEQHGKRVLVLDSASRDPAPAWNLSVSCDYGILDLARDGEGIEKAFIRLGESNMYLARISVNATMTATADLASANATLWEMLKERFDLVLIDSSSDVSIFDTVALASKVDGVVLVVEADKTRRGAAIEIKKKILAGGGAILGVVLNKRRFYIPDFLYKRL